MSTTTVRQTPAMRRRAKARARHADLNAEYRRQLGLAPGDPIPAMLGNGMYRATARTDAA